MYPSRSIVRKLWSKRDGQGTKNEWEEEELVWVTGGKEAI
jgi:hypothetical protein